MRALLILSLLLTQQLAAGPWIPPGNNWLRADIEYLADRNLIKSPITTWPLMWSGIKRDLDHALDEAEFSKLTEREQTTLLRIKKAFRRSTRASSSVTVKLASDTEVIRGFADTPRETNPLCQAR